MQFYQLMEKPVIKSNNSGKKST